MLQLIILITSNIDLSIAIALRSVDTLHNLVASSELTELLYRLHRRTCSKSHPQAHDTPLELKQEY